MALLTGVPSSADTHIPVSQGLGMARDWLAVFYLPLASSGALVVQGLQDIPVASAQETLG